MPMPRRGLVNQRQSRLVVQGKILVALEQVFQFSDAMLGCGPQSLANRSCRGWQTTRKGSAARRGTCGVWRGCLTKKGGRSLRPLVRVAKKAASRRDRGGRENVL